MISLVLKFAAGLLVLYAAIVAFMALNQRNMQYFPSPERIAPGAVGLPTVAELNLTAADGVNVIAWWHPPSKGRPTVLYFHGNAGSLADRAERFADVVGAGFGLLALSYRGYGGSAGSPTEAGLFADGLAAVDHLAAAGVGPVVLYGESLGSGVAVHVAAHRPVAGLVLEAPFTSALDVARDVYPLLPVSWLMKDRYHSDRLIGRIRRPLVILHGTDDDVVPYRLGERLFALANPPKRFVTVEGGGHADLWRDGGFAAVREMSDGQGD